VFSSPSDCGVGLLAFWTILLGFDAPFPCRDGVQEVGILMREGMELMRTILIDVF
jgi:hypothetical protein